MVHSQIISSSLNIQGLKDIVKKNALFYFARGKNVTLYFYKTLTL